MYQFYHHTCLGDDQLYNKKYIYKDEEKWFSCSHIQNNVTLPSILSSRASVSPRGLGRWGERVPNTPTRRPPSLGGATLDRWWPLPLSSFLSNTNKILCWRKCKLKSPKGKTDWLTYVFPHSFVVSWLCIKPQIANQLWVMLGSLEGRKYSLFIVVYWLRTDYITNRKGGIWKFVKFSFVHLWDWIWNHTVASTTL